MHALLEKLLQKRKIKDVTKLNPEEKKTFDTWNKVLSEGDITVEKIQEFCQSQIDIIESKWKDLNIENSKKAEWIPIHNVYSTILLAIKSPRSAKEALEKQLINLTK